MQGRKRKPRAGKKPTDPILVGIGELVKAAREKRHWTITELAKQSGVSNDAIPNGDHSVGIAGLLGDLVAGHRYVTASPETGEEIPA